MVRVRAHGQAFAAMLSSALVASGCGLNMQKNYNKIRPKLVERRYDEAAAYLDSVKESFYGRKNRLLYCMDKAMVLHLGERYEESNAVLEQAKQIAQELWTESVTSHTEAWLTTDNAKPYQGEDFEKVLVNLLSGLNYLLTGEFEGARVEARQVSALLDLYNSTYEEKKNTYRDDAFARYLAGKTAETETGYAALNDAWIDYKKAIALYEGDYQERYRTRVPMLVVEDALRVLDALGSDFEEEFAALRAKYPDVAYLAQPEAEKLAEVILVHLGGEAPYKRDRFWTAPVPDGVLRIAYPEFVRKPFRIKAARLVVPGTDAAATSELVEDIAAIAITNLDDHMDRIKAKAVARQVSKYLVSQGLRVGGRALTGEHEAAGVALGVAGLLLQAASAVAEEADKRSWITLPAHISVARLYVPPGEVSLQVSFLDPTGSPLATAQREVKAVAGRTTFLANRTYQ